MGKRVRERAAAIAVPTALVFREGTPLLAGQGVGGLEIWVGPWQDFLLKDLLLPLLLPLLFLQISNQTGMGWQLGQARD